MNTHTPPSSGIRDVAITAYGITGAQGSGRDALVEILRSGESALRSQEALPPEISPLDFEATVGVIPGALPAAPPLAPFQDTRQLRVTWQAAAQLEESVAQAKQRWAPTRIGVILGTSTGGIGATELALTAHEESGTLPAEFSLEDGHEMHAAARYLAQLWGLGGPAYAVSAACASGAKSLASARRLINAGLCDAVICGGVDSICAMTVHGFHSLGVLSSEACLPFDDTRYGMNVAEGAALLLLERPRADETALAYLCGAGESSDAYHMSAPDPEGKGQARAMSLALKDAGIEAQEVAYLNAHGTGTRANDEAEALAAEMVLPGCPASSSKGLIGHQLGAAGASEAVICLEVLSGLNLASAGALSGEKFPLTKERAFVQSNSFAFGGANVSLIFTRTPRHPATTTASQTQAPLYLNAWSSSADLDHSESKKWGGQILPGRARARAGELTRLCAELCARLQLSQEQLATTPLVFASRLGQLQTTVKLIGLFRNHDSSPLAFQNSVHNAACGALSLALGNREASIALATATPACAALIEAAGLLQASPELEQVAILCADEAAPAPLASHGSSGIALLLSRHARAGGASLEIRPGTAEKAEDAAPQVHALELVRYLDSQLDQGARAMTLGHDSLPFHFAIEAVTTNPSEGD